MVSLMAGWFSYIIKQRKKNTKKKLIIYLSGKNIFMIKMLAYKVCSKNNIYIIFINFSTLMSPSK